MLSGKRYTEGDGPCMDRVGSASRRASEKGHLSEKESLLISIDALVRDGKQVLKARVLEI